MGSPGPGGAAAGVGLCALHPCEQREGGMGVRPWRETHHPGRRLGTLHQPFPARRFGLCFPLGEEEMRVKLRNSPGGGGGRHLSPLYNLNGPAGQEPLRSPAGLADRALKSTDVAAPLNLTQRSDGTIPPRAGLAHGGQSSGSHPNIAPFQVGLLTQRLTGGGPPLPGSFLSSQPRKRVLFQ